MTNPTTLRADWLAACALVGLLTACGSTTPAKSGPQAPAGGHGHAAFVGGYDANRDGVVSRQEYDSVRKQRYVAADTNGDGSLSEAEYVAEFEGRLKQQYAGKPVDEAYTNSIKQAHVRFGILDTNKDGKLSVDEELAIADKTFKGADLNGDGKVDQADAAIKAKQAADKAAADKAAGTAKP